MSVIQFTRARRLWTEDRIGDLWCWALDGLSLPELALRVHAPARECDLALWSALGRTHAEAATVMNRRVP